MKKKYVVKENKDFDKILKKGYGKRSQCYSIYSQKNNLSYDRFGISIGKKVGNAVIRNLYKRKVRAIIDNYKKNYNNQRDYIIILKRSVLDKSYKELDDEFNNLMHNIRKGFCNEKK